MNGASGFWSMTRSGADSCAKGKKKPNHIWELFLMWVGFFYSMLQYKHRYRSKVHYTVFTSQLHSKLAFLNIFKQAPG